MPRLDISVYHDDKDQVKAMGAKWDAVNRIWYVPNGIDPAPFKQWFISSPSPINIRSASFSVALQKQSCWQCSAPTDMATVVLPSGWEEWEVIEVTEEETVASWCSRQAPADVHYIMLLSDTALSAIQSIAPYYKLGLINGHRCRKFFNHCKACGFLQKEKVAPMYELKSGRFIDGMTLQNFSQSLECSSNFQSDLLGRRFDTFTHSSPMQFFS